MGCPWYFLWTVVFAAVVDGCGLKKITVPVHCSTGRISFAVCLSVMFADFAVFSCQAGSTS